MMDAITTADDLDKPKMIVHSEEAAIPQGAKEFYNRLSGEKDELWLAILHPVGFLRLS